MDMEKKNEASIDNAILVLLSLFSPSYVNPTR